MKKKLEAAFIPNQKDKNPKDFDWGMHTEAERKQRKEEEKRRKKIALKTKN